MKISSWSFVTLKQTTEFITDGSHGTHQDSIGGIPLLSAKDVVNNKVVVPIDARRISEKDFEKLFKKYKIRNGDVFLTIVGTLGRSAIARGYDNSYAFQRSVAIIRPSREIQPEFLNYYFQSKPFQIALRSLESKGAQGGVYLGVLEKINVPAIELSEQKRIVSVLETWDKAIESLEKKIKHKKQVKKGLMQQLLTGKKRLPGFDGEWRWMTLGEILEPAGSRNKKLEVSQVLSVTNTNGFVDPEEQFSRRVASEDVSNYKIVHQGDFAYNPSRINVGSIARLDKYKVGIISPMYVVFRVQNNAESDFLLQWLDTNEASSKIKNSVSGSVRDSVDYSAFCGIEIKLPQKDEQATLCRILSVVDSEIEIINQKLSSFKEQKKYLLNNLVTGKIRTQEVLE